MEKKRIFNLKKVFSFLILSLTMFGGLILSSCGEKGFRAAFKKEAYLLSIGETIDITEEIEIENLTLADLTFYSSQENIINVKTSSPLESEQKVELKGVNGGETILYIYYKGETLDLVNITVKEQFAVPTNIAIDESGLITWEAVNCFAGGVSYAPAGYEVCIRKSTSDSRTARVTTNSYQLGLQDKGRIFFTVKAIGTPLIDDSLVSDEKELYYQSLHKVENLTFTNINDGVNEKGTLSWNAVANADYYKLIVDSEIVMVTENNYTFSLAGKSAGQLINVEVVAVDNSGELSNSPVTSLKIKKLGLENVRLSNGLLLWEKTDKATSYLIHYTSLTNPTIGGSISTNQNMTSLDELGADAYSISVQAVGRLDTSTKIYYANSKVNLLQENVAKLSTPEVSYVLDGDEVALTISTEDDALKEFKVKFVESKTGLTIERNATISGSPVGGRYMVTLENVKLSVVGKYSLSVQTLAKDMGMYDHQGVSCTGFLNSSAAEMYQIYRLPAARSITHRYDNDGNSIVSFAKLNGYESDYSKAIKYNFKINGITVENVQDISGYGASAYSFNLGKITDTYKNLLRPTEFVLSIETKLDGSEIFIGEASTKTLNRLSVSNMNLGGEELASDYTFSAINAREYKYVLYSTNSTFDESSKTLVETATISQGRIAKPEAGYYILEIEAIANDEDRYLNATSKDRFFVSMELEAPALDFGFTTTQKEDETQALDGAFSGYYVEISVVPKAKRYAVELDSVGKGYVVDNDGDGRVYYYFAENFSSGSHTINVTSVEGDTKIYKQNFASSTVTVQKLSTPSMGTQDGQAIKFTHSNADLNFYKGTISETNKLVPQVNEGEEQTEYILDMSGNSSDFVLVVKATKEQEEGLAYYIDSEEITTNIHKLSTITNLYFSGKKVHFTYDNSLEDASMQLTPGVRNTNFNLNVIVSMVGASVESTEFKADVQTIISQDDTNVYSFDLSALVAQLALNEDFVNVYTQSAKVKLTMIVESSYFDSVNNTFVFSSNRAISKSDVQKDYIIIEKIAKPEIDFNPVTKQIFWTDTEDFQYKIEINGVEIAAQPVKNGNQRTFDMSSYLVTKTLTTFSLRKFADNYLDSDESNIVTIYPMDKIQTMNIVTENDGTSYARFNFTDIFVNNKENLTFNINNNEDIVITNDETHTAYQFVLRKEIVNYIVNIEGYRDEDMAGNLTYFLGNGSDNFNLQALVDVETPSDVTISDGEMTWAAFGAIGEQKYQVEIIDTADDSVHARITVGTTNLSLNNEVLLGLEQGSYRVEVSAVNKDFTINAGGSGSYGRTVISEGTLVKLDEVQELAFVFVESQTTIQNELSNNLNISWKWNGAHKPGSSVYFDIYVNTTSIGTETYIEGTDEYSVHVENVNLFSEFANLVKVLVRSEENVNSNLTIVDAYRFSAPTLTMDDEKILQIDADSTSQNEKKANSFIIAISVNDMKITEFKTSDLEIDLSQYLAGKSGNVKVEVLSKGQSNIGVWSKDTSVTEGVLLAEPTFTKLSEGLKLSSSVEEAEYYLQIIKQNPTTGNTEVVSLTSVEGDTFVFPDSLVDTTPGEKYIAKAYAKKSGYQTSSVSEFEFEMTRLATITGLNIQKTTTSGGSPLANTYVFAWGQVSNCDKYLFTIYDAADEKTVVVQKEILQNSVQITDTEIFEILNAGNYVLGVKAIDTNNSYTASKEFRKALEVLSEPTNIEIDSNGFVTWVGSGDQYYYATDGSSTVNLWHLHLSDATEIGANRYRYVYDTSVKQDNIHGSNINVYIVKENLTSMQYASLVDKFVLDSKVATKTFAKLDQIADINNNQNTGLLCFKAPEENVTYFFEYTNSLGEKVVKSKVLSFNSDTSYHEILLAEFYDLMEFDTYDTDIAIKVSISQTATQDPDEEKIGKLRSDSVTFTFKQNYANESDYAIFKTEDKLKNYVLIKARENETLKQVFIKNNGEYQIVTDMIISGYLNTYDDGEEFSLTADGNAISSEAVCAILLNDIENSKQGKEFAINIAYAYTNSTGDLLFNTWSERNSYTLLPVVTYLTAEDGKVTWKLNDTNSLSLQTTGWWVELREFENGNTSVIDRIYVKATDEEGRILTSGELDSNLIPNVLSAQIYVASINETNLYVLGSTFVQTVTKTGTQYEKLSKQDAFNQVTKITNGVLSMSLSRGANAPDDAFGILSGETLPAGTSVAKEDLPMGFGNYFENITMQAGTGTFTKYSHNGKTRYLRTADITKHGEGNSETYTTNKETPIYKYYNIALEDLIINGATKFNGGYLQLLKALATTQFSYPFNYTLESLSGNASENNQFVLTFKDKTTQREQEVFVQANDLIVLSSAEQTALSSVVNHDYANKGFEFNIVNGFYEKYTQTEHGLASEKLLFDNIGDDFTGVKGEQIQAGVYDLYLQQLGLNLATGEDGSKKYYSFATNKVLIVEDCEVAPAPSTITARTSTDGITYIYYLKVAPIESNGTLLTNYKLSLKYVVSGMDGEKDVYKTFNITRNGENVWKLNSITLETETVDEKTYFLIPLNGANGLNALIGEALLENTFSVNVIAVGNNSTRLGSKTEQISLKFLNFNYNTLTLNSQGFNWTNYDTRTGSMVVYKMVGLGGGSSTTIRGENCNFMPREVGEYEYIMFMTPGSIDRFSILVGSSIYRFDNVVKMQAPTVEIGREGLFYMSKATGTPTEASFAISNSVETEQQFTQEETYRATTVNATSYSFQTVYNQETVEFAQKCNLVKDGDFFKFKNKVGESFYQVYLASATETRRANMLEKVENIAINENGDIEWEEVTRSARYSTYKTEFEDGETTIAYKVVVEFAIETMTGSGETTWSTDGSSLTLYTTNNFIPSKEIKGTDESQNNYKYFIDVYAFACKKGIVLEGVTQELPEGLVLKNVNYTGIETESYILASEVSEEEFTRLHAIKDTGIAQGVHVQNGKILWDSEYTDSRYLFKVYYNSGEGEVLLNGSVSGPTNIRQDPSTRIKYGTYSFTPIETEESRLIIGNQYTISVYVTDKNRENLTSFMLEDDKEKEIEILPKVESEHIFSSVEMETFTVGGSSKQLLTNTYDLEAYFTAHRNNYSGSLSQINAVFKQFNDKGNTVKTDTLSFYYNSIADKQTSFKIISENASGLDDYVIYLPDGNSMIIEMTATTIEGEEKHLQSYPYTFDLKKKTWTSADTVTYNDDLQRFEWTYGKVKQYTINVDDVAIFSEARMLNAISGADRTDYESYITKGTIIQVRSETNHGSYQVQINNKNIYINKNDVKLEIVDGITYEDTPYFTVEITYRASGEKERPGDGYDYYDDTYTTRTYQNVTDNFFIPEIVGQVISGFSVRVREGIGNLSSAPLVCELPDEDSAEAKKFSLFTSGTGTSEDPYIISNATEFENMKLFGDRPDYLQNYVERIVKKKKKKPVGGNTVTTVNTPYDQQFLRDNAQTQYFFKLGENISLESDGNFVIDKPFYGNLDGDGKTITFTSTSGVNIPGGTGDFVYATSSTNQDVSISFNKYNSIFKEIATGGKVSNLHLNISYTYEQTASTKTLFAGLAIINRGEVSAIQVDSFNAIIAGGITTDLALAGIVGINDGTVLNCSYAADTTIRNSKKDEQNLLFGGIVGFNRQGAQIKLCSYTASAKTLLVTGSTNGCVYAGGIAIGNYNGTIALCGFDGEFKTDKNKKSNFAGIAVYSTSGQLQDLYFNGIIDANQAAGIVFKCVSSIGNCVSVGKINNATSSNYHIAYSFSGTTTGSCYGTERIDAGIIVTKISSSQNIQAISDNTYEIRVTVSGATYTIVIAQI